VEDFGYAVKALNAGTIFKNDAFKTEEVLGRDKAKVILIPDVRQHSSTSQIVEEILKSRTELSPIPQLPTGPVVTG
jgi:hypothetical protein